MKKGVIIIRIEEKTKLEILGLSKKSRRHLSDYLRLLIEDAINKKIKL